MEEYQSPNVRSLGDEESAYENPSAYGAAIGVAGLVWTVGAVWNYVAAVNVGVVAGAVAWVKAAMPEK